MADKEIKLPEPGPQVRAEVRQIEDVYPKGKSGIQIIKKGKKRRTNLNTIVKRKKKRE